jgi:hypothetical protein
MFLWMHTNTELWGQAMPLSIAALIMLVGSFVSLARALKDGLAHDVAPSPPAAAQSPGVRVEVESGVKRTSASPSSDEQEAEALAASVSREVYSIAATEWQHRRRIRTSNSGVVMTDKENREKSQEETPRERHVKRPVTYEVNATPVGASANDFVFAKSDEWSADLETKRIIPGPPGTWGFVQPLGILTRCPKCKKTSFLSPDVSKVMPDGRIQPDIRCMTRGCGWAARAYLDRAWGKTLYAIAVFNRRKHARGKDPREIHYATANSQQEAQQQVILEAECTVIAVAPAVGFKVTDKHGERLIAEG